MKRLFSLVGAMGTVLLASAQLTSISIEAVTVHDGTTVLPATLNPATDSYECGSAGTLIFENGENLCEYPTPELNGYTTYHIYANVTNELDFVSAVYGTSDDPLFLESTGDIFHVDGAADLATAINPGLFEFFPLLASDSWLTIGASNALDGVEVQTTFNASSEALQNFNDSSGFVVQDPIGGLWFNTYGCTEASATEFQLDSLVTELYDSTDSCDAPVVVIDGDSTCVLDSVFMDVTELEFCANDGLAYGGDDLRVLLAQVTTNGDLSGMFNVQVFPNGNQNATDYAAGFTFSSNGGVFGCTDSAATNFDPLAGATIDDLSCLYPCTLALDSAAFTITPPTCAGANDGAIESAVTGQQGADYFYLDTIAGDFSNFGNFSGLLSGTYDVIVVDAAQCGDTLSVTLPDVEPLFMSASLTTAVSCHNAADGVITIDSVSGGSGDYVFAISSNPTELSSDLVWEGIGNTSGENQTYLFTVFDGNGCTVSSEGILVTNPQEMNVSLASINPVQDATCANSPDGEIYLIANGGATMGVGPYTFSVDGETFGPSPLLVTGGTYTVTVKDPLECTATLDEPVVVGPAPIEVNAATVPELCAGDNNGEVSWAPTSGVGTYTYSFDGEATTETLAGGLAPGPYVVAVTDGNGCTGVDTVEVEAAVPITVSATAVDASCFGANDGEIVVSAEGGSGAFVFSDNGDDGTFIPNNEFGGFTAGTYEVFVRDEFNCEASGSATVGEPDEIVVTGSVSEDSPTGEGIIDVFVEGGTLPYTYQWIGDGVSGQTTQDLDSVSTGSYTVEVTDANGCSSIETFNITTDMREIEAGVMAKVYPNPSQGVFNVDIMGGFQGLVQYQVVDAQGRQVLNGKWNATEGYFRTNLDLTGAEAGTYRLIMMANGRPSSLQLMKTH